MRGFMHRWFGRVEMEGICRNVARRFSGKEPGTVFWSPLASSHSYPMFEKSADRCKLNRDGTTPGKNFKGSDGDVVLCKCQHATIHTQLGGDDGFLNGFCAAKPTLTAPFVVSAKSCAAQGLKLFSGHYAAAGAGGKAEVGVGGNGQHCSSMCGTGNSVRSGGFFFLLLCLLSLHVPHCASAWYVVIRVPAGTWVETTCE